MTTAPNKGQAGRRLFDGGMAELGALPLVNDTLTIGATIDQSATTSAPTLVVLLIPSATIDQSASTSPPSLVAQDVFVRSKLLGTTLPRFQVGLDGPYIKQQTITGILALDHKDSTDTAYITVRGLDPSSQPATADRDNDLTTKHFHDRRFSRSFLLMGG